MGAEMTTRTSSAGSGKSDFREAVRELDRPEPSDRDRGDGSNGGDVKPDTTQRLVFSPVRSVTSPRAEPRKRWLGKADLRFAGENRCEPGPRNRAPPAVLGRSDVAARAGSQGCLPRTTREPGAGLELPTPTLRGAPLSSDQIVCRAFRSSGCP